MSRKDHTIGRPGRSKLSGYLGNGGAQKNRGANHCGESRTDSENAEHSGWGGDSGCSRSRDERGNDIRASLCEDELQRMQDELAQCRQLVSELSGSSVHPEALRAGTYRGRLEHANGVLDAEFRIDPQQFTASADFFSQGHFENARARQGVGVFWREFLDFHETAPAWDRDRRFLRTVVHELGHALNLAHAWLVNRSNSTSFMQYPQRYPHGNNYAQRDANYWRDFEYTFDPEEIFHFAHGFYNEVVPGGNRGFMDWSPSSVFNDPTAGGIRANLALAITPGKRDYQFMEPVTLDVEVRNIGHDPVPVGGLSPAYGNVRYLIRRPNGRLHEYRFGS